MTAWGDFNDAAPLLEEGVGDIPAGGQIALDRLSGAGQPMPTAAGPIAPDIEQIAAFLDVVFGYCDGLIPVRGFADQGQGLDTKPHNIWVPADRHAAASLSAYATWAAREGSAVYVIPGTVGEQGQARAEHVLQMQAVVVDLDTGDVEAKLAHLVQHLGAPTLLVESGGRTAEGAAKLHAWWRLFIHAGAPALPAATLTSDDLRGDVTIQGARPRRDLFNGVRAVYVEPAANWQPTDAPPLLASNYVAQDGGEMIYRDLEFPLTTSVSTVQRLMKVELERNRRQRTVAFPANLSALRLRPWEAATVALDRLTPFPARVTAWSLAAEGGVDLTLEEEDAAVWDWNPAVDERATGSNPAVMLPNPGVIAAPASIMVETPQTTACAVLSLSWAAVGSSHLAGYQVEFLPASVAAWQGYGGSLGATAAAIPTAEATGFRVRAVARSGAVSGWRQALVPAAVAAPTATGIVGGIRLAGGFPPDAVRLQVFEATSNSLAAATKLPAEPTSLFWDRTGLTAGDTRWYWLRAVSAEGNVSALVGPVTATAL